MLKEKEECGVQPIFFNVPVLKKTVFQKKWTGLKKLNWFDKKMNQFKQIQLVLKKMNQFKKYLTTLEIKWSQFKKLNYNIYKSSVTALVR